MYYTYIYILWYIYYIYYIYIYIYIYNRYIMLWYCIFIITSIVKSIIKRFCLFYQNCNFSSVNSNIHLLYQFLLRLAPGKNFYNLHILLSIPIGKVLKFFFFFFMQCKSPFFIFLFVQKMGPWMVLCKNFTHRCAHVPT